MEGPDQRNQNDCGDPHQKVQWHTDAHKVGKTIATGSKDHHMGLVADR